MFTLTFNFYLKHEDVGFFPWIKKQDIAKANEGLPPGIRFIEIVQPVVGDIGKIQAKFHLDSLESLTQMYQASLKCPFLSELHTFMDNARPVDTNLTKKVL